MPCINYKNNQRHAILKHIILVLLVFLWVQTSITGTADATQPSQPTYNDPTEPSPHPTEPHDKNYTPKRPPSPSTKDTEEYYPTPPEDDPDFLEHTPPAAGFSNTPPPTQE